MTIISKEMLSRYYIDQKHSVSKIAELLKCSENKINYWIKKYNIKKRTISEAIYLKNNPNGDPFKISNIDSLEKAFLHGLGVGIYWGEGNKKDPGSIRVGNVDPELINKFIEFLVRILGVKTEKIRFSLQIFSDINKNNALKYWINHLKRFNIKEKQFFKITTTKSRSIGTYREKSRFGVLTVLFCNVKLKKIIDNMIADVAQR